MWSNESYCSGLTGSIVKTALVNIADCCRLPLFLGSNTMLFGQRRLLQSVIIVVAATCISGVCDTDYENIDTTETCLHVYKSLESALISDAGNLYRLRKAFFPAPRAEVVLLMVKYNITFAPNNTDSNITCYADGEGNSTLINITTTLEYTYGWSLTGIYTVLDPLILNLMQIQLPFMLLRLTKLLTSTNNDPELSTFLWDGTYSLPSVALNLFVNSLNCTPTGDVFESSINELTMTVSQQDVIFLWLYTYKYF